MPVTRAALALFLSFGASAQGAQLDAEPAAAPASALELAACSLGSRQACFEALLCGLKPEDRSKVQLLSDGTIHVDPSHPTSSANFAALRQVARARATTRLFVVGPSDRYELLNSRCWPGCELEPDSAVMGHPDLITGFMGYTFFPFLGEREEEILYSPGSAVDVYVQAEQPRAALAGTVFHELRHVLAGDFGRAAPQAKHTTPGMTASTAQAEFEASLNGADCR